MIVWLSILFTTLAGRKLWRRLASPTLWKVQWSAGYILGHTVVHTLIYFIAYLSAAIGLPVYPLLPANLLVHLGLIAVLLIPYVKRRLVDAFPDAPPFKRRMTVWWQGVRQRQRRRRTHLYRTIRGPHYRTRRGFLIRTVLTMLGAGIFAYFMTWHVFRFEGSELMAGVSVFSDYAPHTAVMRSFAVGANFPTGYPHFAGDGMAHHFFFYFMAGNYNYLGFSLSWAMNLPSFLAILAFTHVLGVLAVSLSRRRPAYWLAPLLVFFRSSFSVWTWARAITRLTPEALAAYPALQYYTPGNPPSLWDAWRLIIHGDRFPGTLLRDDWGLFASNVYANQRHFVWGITMLLLVVLLWLPALRKGLRDARILRRDRGKRFGSARLFFSPAHWRGLAPKPLILSLLLLLPFPYWHGSTLIVLLLVLFVMALRSRHKAAYLIMAIGSVLGSLFLTAFFSGEAARMIDPAFQWGFLLGEQAGLKDVLGYLLVLFGVGFPLMLILPWVQRRSDAATLGAAALLPIVLALTLSLTVDITVNHKYLMLAYILMTPLIAGFFIRLLEQGFRGREAYRRRQDLASSRRMLRGTLAMVLGIILIVLSTLNGIADLRVYLNKNETRFGIDTDSDFVHWVMDETEPDAVFLTPPWAYHPFFYTGRQSYYGHSYYAWSAGYDTDGRRLQQNLWFSGTLPTETWTEQAKDAGIDYLIVTDGFLRDGDQALEKPKDLDDLKLLATFPTVDNLRIYALEPADR